MIKMMLALPAKVDGEKLIGLTMDVIKGRYGADGYYSGIEPRIDWVYAKGGNFKADVRYYEISAEQLDPVIISTLDEMIQLINGAEYSFVEGGKIVSREWWKPARTEFQKWRGEAYYNNTDAEDIADDYFALLEKLDSTFKSPRTLEYERKMRWEKRYGA